MSVTSASQVVDGLYLGNIRGKTNTIFYIDLMLKMKNIQYIQVRAALH